MRYKARCEASIQWAPVVGRLGKVVGAVEGRLMVGLLKARTMRGDQRTGHGTFHTLGWSRESFPSTSFVGYLSTPFLTTPLIASRSHAMPLSHFHTPSSQAVLERRPPCSVYVVESAHDRAAVIYVT